MRAWSLHYQYLDRQGLWRCYNETRQCLLAQLGIKKMHRNHPQAKRFKDTGDVVNAMSAYLWPIWDVNVVNQYGWSFDNIDHVKTDPIMPVIQVTTGQIAYECDHLHNKLISRESFVKAAQLEHDYATNNVKLHPMFIAVLGNIEHWEKV